MMELAGLQLHVAATRTGRIAGLQTHVLFSTEDSQPPVPPVPPTLAWLPVYAFTADGWTPTFAPELLSEYPPIL
jgi:hypothetical protein